MTLPVLTAALALLAAAACAAPQDYITYPVPDAVTDCPYSVTINGAPAPIEKAGVYQGAYYVRLEFMSPVSVVVRVKSTAATHIRLKPDRLGTNLKGAGEGIQFDVDAPGPRVITTVCGSRELWPLIVFAKKAEPVVLTSEETFVRVRDFVKGDGIQTAAIQKLLDDCAAKGGGLVHFDPGVYLTGPLFVRDNTIVRLAPGCLIQGSSDPKDYREDKVWNLYGSAAPGGATTGTINFYKCRNSAIIGPGVIEAAGHVLRNEHGLHVRALTITGSENITVRETILRNAASWTMHILGSHKVTVDGLKILADWAVGNTDGVNPDCSQDVTISNYFGYCGDDGVAIKTTSRAAGLDGSRNVTVRDSVVMTRKTAFKIGTETHKDVSNVLFENCEAINTSRGIGLYLRDGATISGITYRDLKLDLMEYPGENASGAPFTAAIENRSGIGKMSGIAFERVAAAAPYSSGIFGHPTSKIRDMTFTDCDLQVRNRSIKMHKLPVIALGNCSGVKFVNTRLHWNTDLKPLWDGFLSQNDTENVEVLRMEETSKK